MTAKTSQATVETTLGSRYLQQLCKHWQHKAAATFTPQQGTVTFETWHVDVQATPANLSVQVTVQNAAETDHLQKVVADHLQRFATQETLTFNWGDAEKAD